MKHFFAAIALTTLSISPGFAQIAGKSIPLFFFGNPGIANSEISFIVETPELRAGFRKDSVAFQLRNAQVSVRFIGGSPDTRIEPFDPLPGTANFLIGRDASKWSTGNAMYRKIVYRDLYAGIDMNYSGDSRRMKSEFVVTPGADPSLIRLAYDADRVSIDSHGELVVTTPTGELREAAPEIYQDIAGRRVKIDGRYRMLADRIVGFEIGAYDRTKTLVIDPTISYSTYLGGTAAGTVTAVAVDAWGSLYVTGWTSALNFPIVGSVQSSDQGGVDAFVVKLNAAGTAIVYSTYIGGNGDDRAAAIAVDSAGEVYVTGSTASTNFPQVSSLRSTLGGGRDGFVFKLNAVGNTLLWSTLLGGASNDWGNAIALDSSGNAYVAGDTLSTDFPTRNPLQAANAGLQEAFVTELSSTGAMVYSTYLGGSQNEHAGGIAVDGSGNIYVAGGTFSTNFPTRNALQTANGGGQDAFVTKIAAGGATLIYSTYLGGTGGSVSLPEEANGIAVDASGNAYVAGMTNSIGFPVTTGAFQTAFRGNQDGFVVKINGAGSALTYGTFLGGSSFDEINGIAVDAAGNAYVAGYTSSLDFPTTNGVQAAFNGLYDAFISELNAAGNGLTFSTYFGGTGSDEAMGIALDSSANIFTGGETSSFDMATKTPIQASNTSGTTGWVARIGVTSAPPQVPSVGSVSPSTGSGNTVTFTATYSHPAGATALVNVSLLVNTNASTNYGCYISYSPSTNLFSIANDVASTGGTTVIPGGGSALNDYCSLIGTGSSATLSGTTLTVTISLVFQNGFAGAKSVYLYAQDANTNTGWVAKGTYTATIAVAQPSNVSVSPNGNTGTTQTFQFVWADSQNPANLTATAIDFGPSSTTLTNSCFIVYDSLRATVQLEYDNLAGATTKSITSITPISNSQCSIGAASVQNSGLSIILSLTINFAASFNGQKNIFMYASDSSGASTGWQQMGTFTVATGGFPTADYVVPSSGTGPAQRFSIQVSDVGGSSFVTDVAVLISTSSSNTTGACFVLFDRVRNTLSVYYDNPASGVTTLPLGSTGIASNSQCRMNAANSTVVYGTTSVALTLDLTFTSSFSGAKNVYVYGAEANTNTGWVQRGTWTVTGGVPTAISVSPSSGAGSSLTNFVFSASDSSSGSNLSSAAMLFTNGAPSNTAFACYVVINVTAGTVGLYGDDGVTLSTKPLGSSANLLNSQCAIGGATKSIPAIGTTATFTVPVLFFPAKFAGAKTIYLSANEPAATSGFVSVGSWTVQ